jgi:hypothetical protein
MFGTATYFSSYIATCGRKYLHTQYHPRSRWGSRQDGRLCCSLSCCSEAPGALSTVVEPLGFCFFSISSPSDLNHFLVTAFRISGISCFLLFQRIGGNSVHYEMKMGQDYRPKTVPSKCQDGISHGDSKTCYVDGVISTARLPLKRA